MADHFTSLHIHVNRRSQLNAIIARITNNGPVSAKTVVIDAEVTAAFELAGRPTDADLFVGSAEPPEPPEPPRVRDHFAMPSLNPYREPDDPTEFIWLDRPSHGKPHGRSSCADFRPDRVWEDANWAYSLVAGEGTFRIKVSAEHMAPVEQQATLRLIERDGGWDDPAVRAALPAATLKLFDVCAAGG